MPDDTPGLEHWRAIVGWEGLYEVSDLGRVRSLDHLVEAVGKGGATRRYIQRGRVLATKRKKIKAHAYAFVNLSKNGKVTTRYVHHLVLEAFVGPCPPRQWARHGPAGLMDNRLTNLSWGTPGDNAHDRKRDGTDVKVNQTHCPWGHELVEPNLDPSQTVRGFRRCFACALTQMWGNYRGLRPGDAEWLTEAHRRYAEILHFGRPLNYRLKVNQYPQGGRWTHIESDLGADQVGERRCP